MYYNILSQLKNAGAAKKESMMMPFSNFDHAVLKALSDAGYISSVEKKTLGKRNMLDIKLRYEGDRPAITDFRIISKPSRHLYSGYDKLKSIKQGMGLSILSTSSGIMSGSEARKKKVGGEYLFEIW